MVGFSGILRYWLGRRSLAIVSRFKGRLIKMIIDVNGKFDDYSLSPKIRQLLSHWGYELVESDLFFVHIKMSYYWLNGQELLQKSS